MDEARQDLEILLQVALNTAQRLLENDQGFIPFGVATWTDGSIRPVDIPPSEQEDEDETRMIERTESTLQAMASRGEIRASAVVSDVWISESGSDHRVDAIRVCLEHVEEEPLICYMPYQIQGPDHAMGEPLFESGAPVVFTES